MFDNLKKKFKITICAQESPFVLKITARQTVVSLEGRAIYLALLGYTIFCLELTTVVVTAIKELILA